MRIFSRNNVKKPNRIDAIYNILVMGENTHQGSLKECANRKWGTGNKTLSMDGRLIDFAIQNKVVALASLAECFCSYQDLAMRSYHGIFLVYYVDDLDSFEKMKKTYQSTERTHSGAFPCVLVGCYHDDDFSPRCREVPYEVGNATANNFGCPFFEVSCSKDNGRINTLIRTLIKQIEIYEELGFIDRTETLPYRHLKIGQHVMVKCGKDFHYAAVRENTYSYVEVKYLSKPKSFYYSNTERVSRSGRIRSINFSAVLHNISNLKPFVGTNDRFPSCLIDLILEFHGDQEKTIHFDTPNFHDYKYDYVVQVRVNGKFKYARLNQYLGHTIIVTLYNRIFWSAQKTIKQAYRVRKVEFSQWFRYLFQKKTWLGCSKTMPKNVVDIIGELMPKEEDKTEEKENEIETIYMSGLCSEIPYE